MEKGGSTIPYDAFVQFVRSQQGVSGGVRKRKVGQPEHFEREREAKGGMDGSRTAPGNANSNNGYNSTYNGNASGSGANNPSMVNTMGNNRDIEDDNSSLFPAGYIPVALDTQGPVPSLPVLEEEASDEHALISKIEEEIETIKQLHSEMVSMATRTRGLCATLAKDMNSLNSIYSERDGSCSNHMDAIKRAVAFVTSRCDAEATKRMAVEQRVLDNTGLPRLKRSLIGQGSSRNKAESVQRLFESAVDVNRKLKAAVRAASEKATTQVGATPRTPPSIQETEKRGKINDKPNKTKEEINEPETKSDRNVGGNNKQGEQHIEDVNNTRASAASVLAAPSNPLIITQRNKVRREGILNYGEEGDSGGRKTIQMVNSLTDERDDLMNPGFKQDTNKAKLTPTSGNKNILETTNKQGSKLNGPREVIDRPKSKNNDTPEEKKSPSPSSSSSSNSEYDDIPIPSGWIQGTENQKEIPKQPQRLSTTAKPTSIHPVVSTVPHHSEGDFVYDSNVTKKIENPKYVENDKAASREEPLFDSRGTPNGITTKTDSNITNSDRNVAYNTKSNYTRPDTISNHSEVTGSVGRGQGIRSNNHYADDESVTQSYTETTGSSGDYDDNIEGTAEGLIESILTQGPGGIKK